MDGSKKFKDMLMETIKITRGRISENDVLRDFISFCALEISTLTDPVHLERAEELRTLLERYSLEEREAFSQTFQKLSQIAAGNVVKGFILTFSALFIWNAGLTTMRSNRTSHRGGLQICWGSLQRAVEQNCHQRATLR